MTRSTRVALALAVAFSATPVAPAGAQTSGRLPHTPELPASTRAMALGDAYMMNAGRSSALFYHPALLTGARGFTLDGQRWGSAGSLWTASVAGSRFGGGVALGLQVLQFMAPDAAALGGRAGQDVLFNSVGTPVSERVATVGHARELLGLDVGIAVKLVEERVGSFRDEAALLDIGVSSGVGPFTAALTYHNIGDDLVVGGGTFERPDIVRFGIGAYGEQLGPLDYGVTTAVEYVDEQLIPAAGLEIGYWPIQGRTLVARVGVRRVVEGEASPFSFGFAFWADDLLVEWAFRPYDLAGSAGTHRFSVGWR